MPKINPRIKSIDDLLGLDAAEERPIEPTPSVSLPTKNTIITLPPQAIRAFRGHPFRLYEGDRLNDLVESISEHGVLNPAIIRKIERDEDGFEYEMLAGHNRQNAAAIANRELPCIVKENLSDEDAWIYVIETNVLQRSFSEMLPSEKAAVLTLRYSKMICQGRRNDIVEELKRLENPDEIRENGTCGIECHKSKSRDVVGAEYDLKGRAVANYLRINELITPLKRRIDDAEFPIVVAVQLSYLTEQEQQMVDDVLSESEYKVNEGKVVLLREYTGKLTPERTEQILSGEFNRKPKKSTARVGPVFRYPIDFWGFLRTANKPKKLEWREYKEVYPNLPIFLPPKATEQKIILKKDSLTILGAVFTPPFTLSQLAEKLGPARIVLQNGTRKSPITGRESPYTQALALWDELGLQGWLDEDEQTIKTLGVRVAAQGEYAVRQTFDGTVWIGSKDYREASWKDFAGFAHTLKLGGFTVYTRLPGPVSEEQSAQKAKLEALSAMVQISWKEPEQKAAKAQKYKLSKPTEPVLTFTSFNFKLAVMEVLMYEKGLLAPKLDAHEFAREYSRRKIDIDAEGYEPIPEIRKWLEKYPVPERLAPEVTEIEMDGGSEIYTQLCPFWDGEDGAFDLNTITEAELRQFPNLKHITLMSSKPEQVLPVLERCGIKVDLL